MQREEVMCQFYWNPKHFVQYASLGQNAKGGIWILAFLVPAGLVKTHLGDNVESQLASERHLGAENSMHVWHLHTPYLCIPGDSLKDTNWHLLKIIMNTASQEAEAGGSFWALELEDSWSNIAKSCLKKKRLSDTENKMILFMTLKLRQQQIQQTYTPLPTATFLWLSLGIRIPRIVPPHVGLSGPSLGGNGVYKWPMDVMRFVAEALMID